MEGQNAGKARERKLCDDEKCYSPSPVHLERKASKIALPRGEKEDNCLSGCCQGCHGKEEIGTSEGCSFDHSTSTQKILNGKVREKNLSLQKAFCHCSSVSLERTSN